MKYLSYLIILSVFTVISFSTQNSWKLISQKNNEFADTSKQEISIPAPIEKLVIYALEVQIPYK